MEPDPTPPLPDLVPADEADVVQDTEGAAPPHSPEPVPSPPAAPAAPAPAAAVLPDESPVLVTGEGSSAPLSSLLQSPAAPQQEPAAVAEPLSQSPAGSAAASPTAAAAVPAPGPPEQEQRTADNTADDGRKHGVVKNWNASAGWGFVTFLQGGQYTDAYVHTKQIGRKELVPAKPVSFLVAPLGEGGQPWALDIEGEGIIDEVVCRYYNTTEGCRYGDACHLLHVTEPDDPHPEDPDEQPAAQEDEALQCSRNESIDAVFAPPAPQAAARQFVKREGGVVQVGAPAHQQGSSPAFGLAWSKIRQTEDPAAQQAHVEPAVPELSYTPAAEAAPSGWGAQLQQQQQQQQQLEAVEADSGPSLADAMNQADAGPAAQHQQGGTALPPAQYPTAAHEGRSESSKGSKRGGKGRKDRGSAPKGGAQGDAVPHSAQQQQQQQQQGRGGGAASAKGGKRSEAGSGSAGSRRGGYKGEGGRGSQPRGGGGKGKGGRNDVSTWVDSEGRRHFEKEAVGETGTITRSRDENGKLCFELHKSSQPGRKGK